MATPLPTRDDVRSAPRPATVRVALIVGFVAVAAGFCYAPIHNNLRKWHHGQRGSKDYPLWYETGQRVLHGNSAYVKTDAHGYPFMYPPAAAVILAVGSAAGRLPLVLLQVAINTVAWVVAVVVPVYLLTGRTRPGDDPRDPNALLWWVPTLLCLGYIWNTYLESQPAFLLSAILLLMFACLRKRIAWGAGLCLAVAAGLKGFPIAALPYLLWRREWRAAAWAAGGLVFLMAVAPLPFRGPAGTAADLRDWSVEMAGRQTPTVIGQREARSYTWQNGSLTSVVHRWLRPVVADHDDDVPPISVNVADVPFDTVQHVVQGLTVLFGLAYVLVIPWRDRDRTPFTDAAEAAMLLVLIVLFSPLSFTYNTSWTMLGIAVVLWFVLARARSRRQAVVAAAWLTVALSLLVFTVGLPAFRPIRARGNTFVAEVLLLAELGWILVVERRAGGRIGNGVEPRIAQAEDGPSDRVRPL